MIDIDTTVADTQALVRIDSQNPGVQEGKCAEWVGNRLADIGLSPVHHEVESARSNVVATIPGSGQSPRLVLLGHMDTVPVGDGWSVPPLEGIIRDGKIYGRGACDMKGGMAVALGLMEQLQRRGLAVTGDVVFVATVDEEAPNMAGAQHLVSSGFLQPTDQVLALEPTDMRLRISQMGLRWVEVEVIGRMSHAGRAHLGIDSAHVMAEIISRLKAYIADLPHEDEILGRARFTCGLLNAGVATNVVPPRAKASFDIRIVPPMEIEDVHAIVRSVSDDVLKDFPGASVSIKPLGAPRPPVRASDESKIVRGLRAAYLSQTGFDLPHGGADGHEAYTDASMIAALTGSVSCTVLGPGSTDQAHTADEFVPISDLELAGRLMWSLVESW